MDTFNIIAGIASILSLLLTCFVANKVYNISNKINQDIKETKNIKAVKNKDTTISQAGGDINNH
jgi:hypothetical protein